MRAATTAILAAALSALAAPAWADLQIYSYEAASPEARALAPTGLSFAFERHLFGGLDIREVIQTGERGSANVRPQSDGALGPDGLKAALGGRRPAGRIYAIADGRDGAAFVRAVCPGDDKAWLVIGPLKRFEPLKVQAVGRTGPGPAHLCATLEFGFRNDWVMPQRAPPKARFKSNLP